MAGRSVSLSKEQQNFVKCALDGYNILVDACIGSGKTTSIQRLCCRYPKAKSILYLTYSRLLRIDAQAEIKGSNVRVTNYHQFCYQELHRANNNNRFEMDELIQTYLNAHLSVDKYDVLIIDEYQDVREREFALLQYIKASNPCMQIIAVGDMCQRLYDWTDLKIEDAIVDLLGPNHMVLEFTQCFRISAGLASYLGEIWHKKIVGVNTNCVVEEMGLADCLQFLSDQKPSDILCLGSDKGERTDMQNRLERSRFKQFNKHTLWSKVGEGLGDNQAPPNKNCAIFTTFDGCKGMERPICVIFGFTQTYWKSRIEKDSAKYEIIRNIFCVAASRGKSHIIFVKSDAPWLTKETMMIDTGVYHGFLKALHMSDMFSFKVDADVDVVRSCVYCTRIQDVQSDIPAKMSDGLIDLSMCVGTYQEPLYFSNYNIDADIELYFLTHSYSVLPKYDDYESWSLNRKVLYLTALNTGQVRYFRQVKLPFVTKKSEKAIIKRLSSKLASDANSQVYCRLVFVVNNKPLFDAVGYADVVVDDVVYELKFVSRLTREHILQCAMYMVALNLERGILWNVRTDEMLEIRIPHEQRARFLNCVVWCVTRKQYYNCVVWRGVDDGEVEENGKLVRKHHYEQIL